MFCCSFFRNSHFGSSYTVPSYGGGNENNGDLPQKIPCMYCYGPCPQPCSRPPPIHTFAGNFRPPAGKSPVRSLFLGPGAQGSVVPAKSLFPQFWLLYAGVNGDLLQEDLCHTRTQSLCPCSRPPPTSTSTGDTQTQFCLSLCGVPGSWCTQGLFEPSEHLWQEQV